MSWIGAYRRFEGTRSHNFRDMKYLIGSSVALLTFSRNKVLFRQCGRMLWIQKFLQGYNARKAFDHVLHHSALLEHPESWG